MKTPFNNWDEKLREKMNDYESPVSDDVFKNVMKKREQRKWIAALRKKSRNLLLLLLLLIPFTCNYLKNRTAPVAENIVVQKENNTVNDQSLMPAVSSVESSGSVSPNHSTSPSTNKKENFNSNVEHFNKQPVKKSITTPEKPMNNFSEENSTSGGFYKSSKIFNEEKATASQPDNLLTSAEDLVLPTATMMNKNSTVSKSNTETKIVSSLPLTTHNLSYESQSSPGIISQDKINSLKIMDEVGDSTASIEISPTSWDLHWSLETFFSPDLSFQQLTDVANDSVTLTGWNKRMEKSFTTGLRFSLNFEGGLYVKSGITYSKEQSSFTLQKTWKVPVILDSTYYYTIWHPFEDPTFVFYSDTIIESKDSMVSYASSITYSYWNIPLLIGYTFDLNKFHIGVQSGVVFNAQFSKTGSSIDPKTLEPVTLPESNTSFFRDRASLSFYAGVENEYRFNEHFGIFAEPYFQMQLKPITTDAAPVEQRLHKFGLNTGIKFSF